MLVLVVRSAFHRRTNLRLPSKDEKVYITEKKDMATTRDMELQGQVDRLQTEVGDPCTPTLDWTKS